MRPISTSEVLEPGSWQTGQAQEAMECCRELRDILSMLQDRDRESCDSHWASTEYAVLLDEISAQEACIERLFGTSQEESAEEVSKQRSGDITTPTTTASPMGATSSMASLLEEVAKLDPIEEALSCPDKAISPKPCSKEMRIPVRLTVEDLEDDYHSCEWATDGICKAGCTVGGCRAHMVEAW